MKTRYRQKLGFLGAAIFSASMAHAATYYVANVSITDLGNLGLQDSNALDINNRGVIVGYSKNALDIRRAFRWQNGTMTDLGTPGTLSRSVAEGINDRGEVVGTYWGPNYDEFDNNAFYWSSGTGVVTLDRSLYPGESFDSSYVAMARAINNDGIIVGKVQAEALDHEVPFRRCFRSLPVRWDSPYAKPKILHCPELIDGPNGASDINDSREVAGSETDNAGTDNAFTWKSGVTTHVPVPFWGVDPQAYGINESGHIVGLAHLGTQTWAFRWDGTGGSEWLGTLPGGSFSYAQEVNDQDFVAGTSDTTITASTVKQRAFLWHPDFGFYALPLPAGMTATSTSCGGSSLNNRVTLTGNIQVVGHCGTHAIRWTVQVLTH